MPCVSQSGKGCSSVLSFRSYIYHASLQPFGQNSKYLYFNLKFSRFKPSHFWKELVTLNLVTWKFDLEHFISKVMNIRPLEDIGNSTRTFLWACNTLLITPSSVYSQNSWWERQKQLQKRATREGKTEKTCTSNQISLY